jgi:hypothetical protein
MRGIQPYVFTIPDELRWRIERYITADHDLPDEEANIIYHSIREHCDWGEAGRRFADMLDARDRFLNGDEQE